MFNSVDGKGCSLEVHFISIKIRSWQ